MAAIGWTETVPSGTSVVGTFPAYAKSVWTSVSLGMATEHYWPGSGGASAASAGELLPGASRAFVATQSASSAPGSQMTGSAFLASDTSRLFVYDSTGTYLVGTAFCDLHSVSAGSGYWLRQTGELSVTTNVGSLTVTFNIPYLTAPTVYLTTNIASPIGFSASNIGTQNFLSAWSVANNSVSGATIYWESLGVASSASY